MNDVLSCGETAWDLVHDRSYLILRKYTPSLKGNPTALCCGLFFICGISSISCWFAIIASILFHKATSDVHFLYYLSAYTLGTLPVLALHKNYEQDMSKRDFPKAAFLIRMAALSIYGATICILISFYQFSLLAYALCILGLGVCHGALLGGLSQLASVFPSPCNGFLILGVDLAGIIPLVMVVVMTFFPHSTFLLHFQYYIPTGISLIGLIALIALVQSEVAAQYLGQYRILPRNIEGMENLLQDDHTDQYVSLSSFVSIRPPSYAQALSWGVLVFLCTLCTYAMVPFFPAISRSTQRLPVYLFFAQHLAEVAGKELLCGLVKNAVKTKPLMWGMVILRALLIAGWLVESLTIPQEDWIVAALEVGGLVLIGLVGGAINPSVYLLAGLRTSDDTRDSLKAMSVCMWCSVGGALTALAVLNVISFIHPSFNNVL